MEYARHPRVPPPTLARVLARQSNPTIAVESATSLAEAAGLLARQNGAALVLTRDGMPVAVFDAVDLALQIAENPVLARSLGAMATPPLRAGAPDDLLEPWLETLRRESLRHVAVISGGQLAGVASLADLLAESDAHHRRVVQAMILDERIMFKRGTYSC